MENKDYEKMTFVDLVEKWSHASPERAAVQWCEDGQCMKKTYKEFYEDILACADHYFKNDSYRRIALCGQQDYHFLVLLMSILRNYNSAVVVTDFVKNEENKILLKSIGTSIYVVSKGSEVEIHRDEENAASIKKGENLNEQEAVVLLTSGTTGRKKCVSLSHQNLVFDAMANIKTSMAGFPSDMIPSMYSFLPFSHAFALQGNIATMLYGGGTIQIGSGPVNFMKEISLMKPTHILAVPQIIKGIMGYLKLHHVDKVGEFPFIACGGAKLDDEIMKKAAETGITIFQGYGTTECAPIVSANCLPFNKPSSCGRVFEGVDVKILDGEILVKGPNVFNGYINDEEATQKVFLDGYYRTGDKGFVDDEGFLFVNGRIKDTIVLATGENVSPSALEEKLMNGTCIKDAYVYEKKTGNVGCITAVIYANGMEEKALAAVSELNQKLEEYEKIRQVEFSKDPLMRTELGKIRRVQNYEVIRKENVK